MKTSELTGAALDWAVAKAQEYNTSILDLLYDIKEYRHYLPSTKWDLAGPIIEQEKIGLDYYPDGSHKDGGVWAALMAEGTIEAFGPTPLIAAMRCFCYAKLGDEIEIPASLCS
jgi:hypothetical protein